MSGCPKNYTWSCQQCSNLCKDYHISKPAPVSSAEELEEIKDALDMAEKCGEETKNPTPWQFNTLMQVRRAKLAFDSIESVFAAQRQAEREEADKEIKRYEAFAERRIAKIGSDIEVLNYRYTALVEAARPFAQYEDGDAGKCWDPSRIKLGKALSDLDEVRKGETNGR